MSNEDQKKSEMKRRDFLHFLGGLVGLAATSGVSGLIGHKGDRAIAVSSLLTQCAPNGSLPAALGSCRNWISFAPPRPFNPNQNVFPTKKQLRKSLRLLSTEGWRGLVTYSLDGTLQYVPRIAKGEGFTEVTTSEPSNQYMSNPSLLMVGDWVFPNIQPYLANKRSIPEAIQFVQQHYQALQAAAPDRNIIIKEAWWPTDDDDPAASETNQTSFFQQLAGTGIEFIWGEAFDQFWKTDEGPQGPHWGFHTDLSVSKRIIQDLQSTYTGPY